MFPFILCYAYFELIYPILTIYLQSRKTTENATASNTAFVRLPAMHYTSAASSQFPQTKLSK